MWANLGGLLGGARLFHGRMLWTISMRRWSQMPAMDQSVLEGFYDRKTDTVELASDLGVTPRMVKVRLFRARSAPQKASGARLARLSKNAAWFGLKEKTPHRVRVERGVFVLARASGPMEDCNFCGSPRDFCNSVV